MEEERYFPKFIAPWESFDWGVKIYSTTDSISLEGADARTIDIIETICSGLNNLSDVTKELSVDWDSEQVGYILDLFIEKKVIVNVYDVNRFKIDGSRKIEIVSPNLETKSKLKLPYEIIYGRCDEGIWSCGKDQDISIARKKLISEIIEWNVWSNIQCVEYKKPSDINYLHPSSVVAYSDDQYDRDNFPFKKFSEDSVYGWVKAISLVNNNEIYILADHILFPYNGDYTKSTSSGSAAHSVKNNLIDHSIYELIERDAFMIFWLNRLCSPSIRINTIPSNLKKRVNNIITLGYIVSIKSIGLDIHPVVFVAIRNSGGVYVTSGIASGSDPFQVLDSALSEVEITLLHILNLKKKKISFLTPENVVFLVDHENLHQQSRFKKETDFLFREFEVINFSDFINLFSGKNILIKLENLGFDILEVDASDWEIDILLPEFRYVSRCIVPGLVPLSYGFGNEPLGMSRIYDVPKIMNLKRFNLIKGELNLFPHPFN